MLELHSCLICSHSLHVRDLEFIVKSSEEHGSDIFRQILQAKCPSIYGHGLVKGISSFCVLKGLHNVIMIHFPQCLKHLSLFLGNVDCAIRHAWCSNLSSLSLQLVNIRWKFTKQLYLQIGELWCLQILDTVVLVNLIKCLQNIRLF
ncbi:hypothetical protein NC651_035447 [Populus alba x Populus x berolinensis]|nr:hypothetical protein NC651_035447 [Populus alba x Populus x berolinensis]